MTDPQNFSSHTVPSLMKRLWVHGFLVGFALVLVILLAWVFLRGGPEPSITAGPESTPLTQAPPSQSEAAKASPAVSSPAPADAALPLKDQLQQVLAGIRDANLIKDLSQMLDLYSPSFPDRKKKAENISRLWETYDYLDMDFQMAEVKYLAPQRAFARVTWNIETRNRKTSILQKTTKTYLVWFTRESDQWRIQALENPPPAPRGKP
jgi:ketosteroid isomerase-like protein